MIKIPGTKWFQTNRSKIFGNLWATFNIDLQSSLGIMRVSPRVKVNTATADVASLSDFPAAFKYFGSAFYTVAKNRIFKGGEFADDAFAEDAGTNTQTTYTSNTADLELFNGLLFSTTTTDVWSLTGTTWTQRGGASSLGQSDASHMMTFFKKFNRLYVISTDDLVYSFNTSYTLATSGDYTLNLGTSQQLAMLCMKANSDSIWIGAGSQLNVQGNGKIYQWDGISAQPTAEYTIGANACLAICILNDVPYAMDSRGALLRFNGAYFEEVARLPGSDLESASIYANEGCVHPNGLISTRNGTILALVNNLNSSAANSINENFPSGVWEWSPEYGFTHKYSVSYNPAANATITDFGQNRLSNVGAIFPADIPGTTAKNGTLLIGARYFTDATNTTSAVLIDDSDDTVQKFGYFVTTWIKSENLKEVWSNIILKYRQLLASTDRIIVKYRTREAAPTYIDITWVNTTSFTTATDVSAMIGYEVEIIQGTGSGKCAHITAVSGSYTVTIDEAVTGVTTGTAKARVQAWRKLIVVDDQTTESVLRNLKFTSERIQLKVTMLFTGEDEFHELVVVNKPGERME